MRVLATRAPAVLVLQLAILAALLLPVPAHTMRATHATPWYRVFVTGYDDRGRTATGTEARYGEVAVDPRAIPLGSWIEVQGIPRLLHAEDTGGLVRGYHIDVWLSTTAACYKITSWRMARWSKRKGDLR